MKFFICKDEMTESTNTDMQDLGSCIVIIKNVPCMKCRQCGEVSYSGTVVRQIEKIVSDLKNSLTEVAIVNYSKTA